MDGRLEGFWASQNDKPFWGNCHMREFFSKNDLFIKISLVISVTAIFLLGLVDAFDLKEKLIGKADLQVLVTEKTIERVTTEKCGEDCEELIDEKVNRAIKTKDKGSLGKVSSPVLPTQPKTSYIPIGTAFSTTKTEWTDVLGGEVYIDPADYGEAPVFGFEVSVKIANKNGVAWVRLYDSTNNIAVSGSELTSTTSEYSTVSVSNLPFWSGKNLYRIQIKSTTSQEVSVTGGKVKVTYK